MGPEDTVISQKEGLGTWLTEPSLSCVILLVTNLSQPWLLVLQKGLISIYFPGFLVMMNERMYIIYYKY